MFPQWAPTETSLCCFPLWQGSTEFQCKVPQSLGFLSPKHRDTLSTPHCPARGWGRGVVHNLRWSTLFSVFFLDIMLKPDTVLTPLMFGYYKVASSCGWLFSLMFLCRECSLGGSNQLSCSNYSLPVFFQSFASEWSVWLTSSSLS